MCHATHAYCSPDPTRHFLFPLHPQGTAWGTPPGPLGAPPHLLCCPLLHGLHARLSSRQYLRLPLLHCPSRRNLLHRPPCSVPCTALCLCLAHSRPRVALKSWRDLQCPPCSLCLTPHTLHSSASLPFHARTPTARNARRSTVLAFSGAVPSGGGARGKSCIIPVPGHQMGLWLHSPGARALRPRLPSSWAPSPAPCLLILGFPFLLSSSFCLSHLTTAALPLG